MTEQSYTPQAMAAALDVSPATLRRWTQRFSRYLSADITGAEQGKNRRYTATDLITLRRVQEWMRQGLTYEQVNQQLTTQLNAPVASFGHDDPSAVAASTEKGLVVAGSESPAAVFLTHTLAALSESQKSILNSQAANRELMGVLIQDNFNLKEENNRLRERMLDIERNLAQVRQETEWQRDSLRQELDGKIMAVQQTAVQAVTAAQNIQAPDIKAVKSKPGCLGALFGGGDVQIISLPRHRDQRADGRQPVPVAAPPPPTPFAYPAAAPEPSRPVHPKPMAPPE